MSDHDNEWPESSMPGFGGFLKTLRTRHPDKSPITWQQIDGREPWPSELYRTADPGSNEQQDTRQRGSDRGPLVDKLEWLVDIEPVMEAAGTLVQDLLDAGAMSCLYGAPNAGKSFWALDLDFHIAAQKPWREHEICRDGVAIYLAAEGAGRGMKNRLAALRLKHGVEGVPLALLPCRLDLFDPDADTGEIVAMIQQAQELWGLPTIKLTVDTLARTMAGGDENSSKDMAIYVANVQRIQEALPGGVHVMIIHHCGKDAAKGARGSSALLAAVDTELEISRVFPNDKELTHAGVLVSKQRDMPAGQTFWHELEDIEFGQDARGKVVKSAVVRWLDTKPERPGQALIDKAQDAMPTPASLAKGRQTIILDVLRAELAKAADSSQGVSWGVWWGSTQANEQWSAAQGWANGIGDPEDVAAGEAEEPEGAETLSADDDAKSKSGKNRFNKAVAALVRQGLVVKAKGGRGFLYSLPAVS